jgi:hypothetical protein
LSIPLDSIEFMDKLLQKNVQEHKPRFPKAYFSEQNLIKGEEEWYFFLFNPSPVHSLSIACKNKIQPEIVIKKFNLGNSSNIISQIY